MRYILMQRTVIIYCPMFCTNVQYIFFFLQCIMHVIMHISPSWSGSGFGQSLWALKPPKKKPSSKREPTGKVKNYDYSYTKNCSDYRSSGGPQATGWFIQVQWNLTYLVHIQILNTKKNCEITEWAEAANTLSTI